MNAVDTRGCRNKSSMVRYLLESLGVFVIFFIVTFASIQWLKLAHPPAPWKYLIVTLPVLPMLLFPLVVLRFIRTMDELQRRIRMEGTVIAYVLVSTLALTGALMAGVGFPQLRWVHAWIAMPVCWVIGAFAAKMRWYK